MEGKMRIVCFELTMPNVGSWNGKWSGADKKYYIIKSFSNKFYSQYIEPHLDGNLHGSFHYSFGDGWSANVSLQVIDSDEAKKRRKLSAGFSGYDWMVQSIINFGEIKVTKLLSNN